MVVKTIKIYKNKKLIFLIKIMVQINNMGIKKLTQCLRKYEVYETLDIALLKYTKVAIDTPMFLFKFKGVTEPTTNDWLGCFVTFVAFLRKYDIHPIFLFEGKSPPEKAPAQ